MVPLSGGAIQNQPFQKKNPIQFALTVRGLIQGPVCCAKLMPILSFEVRAQNISVQ